MGRITRAVTAFCTLALLPATVLAAEEVIRFDSGGGEVVGTLSLPDGGPAPVVLLCHGFTGVRDELAVATTDEGVFSRTARALREAGYASLRIDFRGSGDSSGDFADTTFEGQITDGLAAVDWLAAEPRVKGTDLGIIGWSQGGLVASAVAGRSGAPKAVALWAAVATPEATFRGILGDAVVDAGLATGDTPLEITLPWGAVIGLKQGYFDQLRTVDPVQEIAAYKGPLFVAQGTLDTTVLPASADLLIAAHTGPQETFIAGMDHVFNAFTGPQTLDQMVAATIAFLDENLK
jgi:dipeptidyl aminopeptidase/acylaminoacyl peptidase